jgi:multidrug resistance efflux pump
MPRCSKVQGVSSITEPQHGSRPEVIAQARAQLGQQQATFVLAKANLKRAQELRSGGGISKEEIDQRREAVGVARRTSTKHARRSG